MIDVTIEQVSPEVGSATLHGWNTCRLIKTDGALWFVANKPTPDGDDHNGETTMTMTTTQLHTSRRAQGKANKN